MRGFSFLDSFLSPKRKPSKLSPGPCLGNSHWHYFCYNQQTLTNSLMWYAVLNKECQDFRDRQNIKLFPGWQPTLVLLPGKSHGQRGLGDPTVHGVSRSWTQLSNFTFTFHFHVLEKEMATHSSVLAWRIPGTAEPGGLPSTGSHRVGHNWSNLAVAGR